MLRVELVIGLFLVALTVGVYWPVRHFDFLNFDDPSYVTANPNVFRGPTSENIKWALTAFHAGNWHPLAWISHMLDCAMFGPKPAGHHLVNAAFHALNALLVFSLFRQLTGARYRSAMVAALFAVHPLHIESVAWIAERKDVLSTFFGLLALNAYARYALLRAKNLPWDKTMFGLALVFFALSLMSKPMWVTLPFVLLLLDFWPLNRFNRPNAKGLLLEKLPFLILSAATSYVTILAQKEAIVAPIALPFTQRLINAVMSYFGYLRKMVLPTDLAAYYPYRHNFSGGEVAVALLVLVGISIFVIRFARRFPYLLTGWLWYLGMLVPVIGLVQVGGQSMADRYTYMPLVGIFVMCVWGAGDLLSKAPQRKVILIATSAAVLLVCTGSTSKQLMYWRDSEALFRRDLELYPEANAMGHHCLGRALFLKGDDAEAISHQEEVLRLLPNFAPGHLNLANSLSRQQQFVPALFHYEQALRFKPEDAETYKCLGSCLAAQMRLDEAKTNFLTALRFNPNYPEAHTRLGTLLMAQGKVPEALQHLELAVQIYPDYYEGHYYLANALADQKKFSGAADHFRAALKVNPDYVEALDDFAWMRITQMDTHQVDSGETIRLAQRACDLTQSTNVVYLQTLGAAFSEAGKFAEAIVTVEKAIAVATSTKQKNVASELQRQLALYRGGQSYSSKRP